MSATLEVVKADIDTSVSYYIASRMTWIPQFNFPRFDEVAADLRSQGLTIQSPAELDDPATREAAMSSVDGAPGSGSHKNETWGDFLARDLKLIADVVGGTIVFDDWWNSEGARTETYITYRCKKPILEYPTLEPVDKFALVRAWLS